MTIIVPSRFLSCPGSHINSPLVNFTKGLLQIILCFAQCTNVLHLRSLKCYKIIYVFFHFHTLKTWCFNKSGPYSRVNMNLRRNFFGLQGPISCSNSIFSGVDILKKKKYTNFYCVWFVQLKTSAQTSGQIRGRMFEMCIYISCYVSSVKFENTHLRTFHR